MKTTSLKKNYIYNLLSEIIGLLVPLITTPYVSRVLHEEGIGQYSFAYSIVSYFVLLGVFGFGQYSQRVMAKVRNNNHDCSVAFWELFFAKFFTSLVSVGLFLVLLFSQALSKYNVLLIVCSSLLIDCAFNIVSYYRALEEFKFVSFRNILVKLLGLVLIFVFVKTENDTWIYALCLCGSTLVGNLLLWPSTLKRLDKIKISELNVKQHFLPALLLFLPSIALSVYSSIDKTLIGFLSTDSDYQNGCYEQAYKIITILTTIVTIIGPVMLSRNTHLLSEQNEEEFRANILFSLNYVWVVAVPLIAGTLVLAPNISSWLFGEGYDDVPQIMYFLSPIVLFMGISNAFGIQYLLPKKKDNHYAIAILSGTVLNICLNILFIPRFSATGAAIGTAIAEAFIMIIEACFVFKFHDLKIKDFFIMPIKYLIAGGLMFALMFCLQRFLFNYTILSFFIIGFIGVVLYILLLLLLRDSFLLKGVKYLRLKMTRKKKTDE